MKAVIIYGNAKRGNTYTAAQIFKDELSQCGEIAFTEFVMPTDLPEICTGCQLCLGNPNDKCPHSGYVAPILDAILQADALIFASPHCGAETMPSSMKNFFDHFDFLVMTVAPRIEMFSKKAFVITTGTGSTGAAATIVSVLKHWGVNRVHSLSLRLFTDKWKSMPQKRQKRFETALRKAAQLFYKVQRGGPYIKTVFFYYLDRFVLKKYVGKGKYPFEYWRENGFFEKRPF